MSDDALREEILDLGLEDAIPLWEVAGDCRTAGLIPDGTTGIEALSRALLDVLREGDIRVLVGPGPTLSLGSPSRRKPKDSCRIYAGTPPRRRQRRNLERVYYVNVDNLLD